MCNNAQFPMQFLFMYTKYQISANYFLFSIDLALNLCYNIIREREELPRTQRPPKGKEEIMMNGFEKMLEMLTEACEIALGDEWGNMTDQEKHDTIMGFIATAAKNAK